MVTNPVYEALNQLYSQLKGDAATMGNALKPADQQMSAGKTWVGPAARSWGNQLNGHSRDCARQVNAMLAEVEAAMAAQPAQVTQQEAQALAKDMSLIAGGIY